MKKIFAVLFLCLFLYSCKDTHVHDSAPPPEQDAKLTLYNEALEHINNKEYNEAYSILSELEGYKDSAELLSNFFFKPSKWIYKDTNGLETVTEYQYDDDGKLIEQKVIDSDGGVTVTTFSSEDLDNGGRIEENNMTLPEGVTWKYVNVYDAQDNMISEKTYYDGTLSSAHEFEYDSNGRITSSIYETEEFRSNRLTEYTDSGEILNEIYEDSDGKDYTKVGITDSEGRIIKTTYTSLDGSSSDYVTTYGYLGDKRISAVTEFSNGSTKSEKWEYDDAGNVTLHETFSNGISTTRAEYTYSDGKLLSSIETSQEQVFEHYFEYDSNGREIKEIRISPDGFFETTTVYNQGGIVISESCVDENGEVVYVIKYNEKGNPTSSLNPDGELVFIYDKFGNTLETTDTDSDGTKSVKDKYENYLIFYNP